MQSTAPGLKEQQRPGTGITHQQIQIGLQAIQRAPQRSPSIQRAPQARAKKSTEPLQGELVQVEIEIQRARGAQGQTAGSLQRF